MSRAHQTPDPEFLNCFAGRQRLSARQVAAKLDITARGLDSIWPGLQHAPTSGGDIVGSAKASRSALELAWRACA